MDRRKAIELLGAGEDGVAEWNRLRQEGEEIPDLSKAKLGGANLRRAGLSRADLRGADLCRADLASSSLREANLTEANLTEANLSGANLTEANLSGANLTEAKLGSANLRLADLSGANSGGAILNKADLSNATLSFATFTLADLRGANFSDAKLDNAILADAQLRGASFHDANLTGVTLAATDLRGVSLRRADLSGADLRGADLCETSLHEIILRGADLSRANLNKSDLCSADLSGANLKGADLSGANLCNVNLSGANLTDSRVDSNTNFKGVTDVTKCKVDRYTMEYMSHFLTQGQKMDLIVTDDVAVLRSQYSGVWIWVHVISLTAFCAPYAWFLVQQWSVAMFQQKVHIEATTIPLWEAMLRYIFNGGLGWREGWNLNAWSLSCFCLILIYNALRAVLLWKTVQLETQQKVSGLPVQFSLAAPTGSILRRFGVRRWSDLYGITYYGYYVMLLLVLVNTVHFMSIRVPTKL